MSNPSDSISDAHAQIARLRQQVEALMNDRVTPAVSEFTHRAGAAVNTASETVRDQANAMSGRVKQQPLVAILIATAIGWVIGRAMR
jgi:ElaB/YqjD/DUF883 family membrane-anchored ribosome-binding protein